MTDEELIKKYVSKEKQPEALEKLASGYPVQYIIGNVEFYDTLIKVNEDVLIPRFETEYLVDKTIKYLSHLNINNPNILDIGTGSGCIAIDISEKAILIAKENAANNNVDINFTVQDIHKFNSNKKYDLIISNPPYVPFNSNVDEKIKYEPQNAIYAKDNGLYFYDLILQKTKNNFNDNFLIAFEIGNKEGQGIINIIKKYLPNSYVLLEKDYNNYDRYIFISNQKI